MPQIEGEAYEDPTDWEVCEDGYGGTYYYNVQTGESRWKKPNFRIEDVELVHGPGYEGLTLLTAPSCNNCLRSTPVVAALTGF